MQFVLSGRYAVQLQSAHSVEKLYGRDEFRNIRKDDLIDRSQSDDHAETVV